MAKKPLPSASDYPPLEAWLTEHNAREAWRITLPNAAGAVACYVVGVSTALALLRPDGRGWELYTCVDSNDVSETLADAHDRVVGVASPTQANFARAVEAVDVLTSERDAAQQRAQALEELLAAERGRLEGVLARYSERSAEVARLQRELADAKGHARRFTAEGVEAARKEQAPPDAPVSPTVTRGYR